MPVKSNGRGAGNGVGSGTGNNGKGASDAFPDFDNPVAVFDYRSADGVLLYQRVRYRIVTSDGATVLSEKGRPDKTFRERRLDESGGWVPNLGGVAQIPYRLPDLVQAIADSKTVFVPKSEGKADHLAAWGFAATYVDKGVKPEDYIERFRGADIVLMPDNDDAGWEHINNIGATLQGVAGRIRVLVLPGLPHKGDVIDWAAAGGTPEQLRVLAGQAPDWEPLAPSAEATDEEAEAAADEAREKLIDELARMTSIEYERCRADAAGELGMRRPALDRARQERREELDAERKPPPLFGHWITEPRPEEVDSDALVQAIVRRVRSHVVLAADQALTAALWTMMTWVHQEAAVHSPILLATSPEADSGKTTLANVVGFLVRRGLTTVGITGAVLYRIIEMYEPTLVVDEADVVLVENDDLRAIINSGWTRGSGVPRCVGGVPTLFSTFAPKMLAMKGLRLPDTTMSRCLTISLKRRKRTEAVDHFKHIDDAGLADLRRQALRWSIDNVEALKSATPRMPDGFDNRTGDNWRLLFAIADLAGAEWPERARQAAVAITKAGIDKLSIGVMLLTDIKAIFDELGKDRLASGEVVTHLGAMEGRPWAEFGKSRKPITTARLAILLSGFQVFPAPFSGGQQRGYHLSQFEDAFARYL